MYLISFGSVFPEQAAKEVRTMTFLQPGEVPPDEYALLESYCPDPGCDCQRVMLNVLARSDLQPRAAISYGFRPDDPYRGPYLDPLDPQSEHAEALLEHVAAILAQDRAYVRRLKQHYGQIKQAAREGRIRESAELPGLRLLLGAADEAESPLWAIALAGRGLMVPAQRVRLALARFPDGLALPELPRWTGESLQTPASQWMEQMSEPEQAFWTAVMTDTVGTSDAADWQQASRRYFAPVEALSRKYPQFPAIKQMLHNFLRTNGETARADAFAREMLAAHPGYLFARVNLLDQAVRARDYDAAEALLPQGTEIYQVVPEGQRLFHGTEIRAFYSAVFGLHLGRGRLLRALWALSLVGEAAGEHPITERIVAQLLALPERELRQLAEWLEPPRKLSRLGKRRR